MKVPKKIKQDAIKKWQGILKAIPKESRDGIKRMINRLCAFCYKYKCVDCPADANPCESDKWNDYYFKVCGDYYWREPATEFCKWVIGKLKKL